MVAHNKSAQSQGAAAVVLQRWVIKLLTYGEKNVLSKMWKQKD